MPIAAVTDLRVGQRDTSPGASAGTTATSTYAQNAMNLGAPGATLFESEPSAAEVSLPLILSAQIKVPAVP